MLLTNTETSDYKTACKLVHVKTVPVSIKKSPSLQLEFLSHDGRMIKVEVQPSSLVFNDEMKEITNGSEVFLICYDKEYTKIKDILLASHPFNNKVNIIHVLSPKDEENRKFNELHVKAFSLLRNEGYESLDMKGGNVFHDGQRHFTFIGSEEEFTNLLETTYPSLTFLTSVVAFETLTSWPVYSLRHSYVEGNRLVIYNYQNENNALNTLKSNISLLERIAV